MWVIGFIFYFWTWKCKNIKLCIWNKKNCESFVLILNFHWHFLQDPDLDLFEGAEFVNITTKYKKFHLMFFIFDWFTLLFFSDDNSKDLFWCEYCGIFQDSFVTEFLLVGNESNLIEIFIIFI